MQDLPVGCRKRKTPFSGLLVCMLSSSVQEDASGQDHLIRSQYM